MASVDQFLARYPEFRPAYLQPQNANLIECAFREADRSTGAVDRRDDLVYLKTAKAVAHSPLGRAAQLLNKDGSSSYSVALNEEYQLRSVCNRFV